MADEARKMAAAPRQVPRIADALEAPKPQAGKQDMSKNRYAALFKDIVFQHVSGGKVYKRGEGVATKKVANVVIIAAGILPLRGKVAAVQARGKKAVPEFNTMGTPHQNCVIPPADDPSLVAEWKAFKRWIANDLYIAWRAANPATADNTLPDDVTLDDVELGDAE